MFVEKVRIAVGHPLCEFDQKTARSGTKTVCGTSARPRVARRAGDARDACTGATCDSGGGKRIRVSVAHAAALDVALAAPQLCGISTRCRLARWARDARDACTGAACGRRVLHSGIGSFTNLSVVALHENAVRSEAVLEHANLCRRARATPSLKR